MSAQISILRSLKVNINILAISTGNFKSFLFTYDGRSNLSLQIIRERCCKMAEHLATFDYHINRPLSFPLFHEEPVSLTWLPVRDWPEGTETGLEGENLPISATIRDPRLALCLCSRYVAIEGFGHEYDTYVLGPEPGLSSPCKRLVRHRITKIRFIPTHIVESERSKVARFQGFRSSVLDSSYGEVLVTHSSKLRGVSVFVKGLRVAGIRAQLQTIRVLRESNDEFPTNCLFFETLGIRVELPDNSGFNRVIQPISPGRCEIREGLILYIVPSDDSQSSNVTSYYRPARDIQGKMSQQYKVAVKTSHKLGRFSTEDPSREAAAINYIISNTEQELNNSTSSSSSGIKAEYLREGLNHIMQPIVMSSDDSRQYLVTALYDSDLLLESIGPEATLPSNPARVRKIFRQLAHAVFVLHNCGVSHRDISLENILIQVETLTMLQQAALDAAEGLEEKDECSVSAIPLSERCVLIDFELSQLIQTRTIEEAGTEIPNDNLLEGETENNPVLVRNQCLGKIFYLPLENRGKSNEPIDPFACDMWALGIVLLMMTTGRFPFDRDSHESAYTFYHHVRYESLQNVLIPSPHVRNSSASELRPLNTIAPADAIDAILRLLQPDRRQRITASQLMQHPYVAADER